MSEARPFVDRERDLERIRANMRKQGVYDPTDEASWAADQTAKQAWRLHGVGPITYAHHKAIWETWGHEETYKALWQMNPELCRSVMDLMLTRNQGSAFVALQQNAGNEPAYASGPVGTRSPDYGRPDADLFEDEDQPTDDPPNTSHGPSDDLLAQQTKPRTKPMDGPSAAPTNDDDQTSKDAEPSTVASGGHPAEPQTTGIAKTTDRSSEAPPQTPNFEQMNARERRNMAVVDRVVIWGVPLWEANAGQCKSFARKEIMDGKRMVRNGRDKIVDGLFVQLLTANIPDTMVVGQCYKDKDDPIFETYFQRALEEARQHVQF